ncbi:aminotransferase class III-fold pyridoxal phosphate-dependent enzyme [Hyunsoonleella sp. SJ7]|uniref:Aminotransferase class III-fold pyridoxal phosphate-dependent enzyme n=1 Tax=Hyunsoonleella aquatilis TaxID=2762758 RepID=A0A923KIQ9_9FLAO|nr:aminotransferase class III-fold pyridoxal phosphate-dependent enzyme [Hyunsoonleella aquatilis]MBC3759009.1 aminotransferase class III-fold pyridoxal phosphate-dependent enzyme [Hyunsoonleella aquatilis]
MKAFIEKEFGFTVDKIKHLNGYDNENHKILGKSSNYVFKTYAFSDSLHDIVKAENAVLVFLEEKMDKGTPSIVPFNDNMHTKVLEVDNEKRICRMLSFLEGKFMGDVEHTPKLFESFGSFLAKMDKHLANFKSHTIQARQWEWDLQYFDLNKKFIGDISNPRDRSVIIYFFEQFEEVVRPHMPELRKQIIHNDANEWNVLVQGDKVAGIIDFGDLAHSFLINELAIAITYGSYDKEEPLQWATIILQSYNAILPLKQEEVKVLYYLIAARLCTSLCNSAHAKKTNPENTYASVSEKHALKMLHKWLAINPVHAENEFRKAIGLSGLKPVSVQQLIERRLQHVSKNLSLSYDHPIHMVRSAFQYMYDASGNTFLDAYNNIPHVGHAHPKVVKAGQNQMARLNTNTRYLYDELNNYAEKLLSYFPKSLNKVFFVNSGSAASDLAMRMAHHHTKAKHIMVMESGYHGNTQTSMDISDYKFNNPKGEGQKAHVIKTPLPNVYKGKYAEEQDAGVFYGKDAVRQIQNSAVPIAAFISEPIVGCAGQVPLADGYLKQVYPAIRAQNGVCISDEVQTGFGRLGEYFWGFEAQDVIPDMVVLGKPIANGHPMGAVVCTDEIASSFEQGVEFFSSFGGNPVSCAIASAVLDVIEEENLQENAREVGNYYQSLLKKLSKKYECIGDVRGGGLFIGVEIVKDGTKDPDTKLAQFIKNEMKNSYILVSTDGPFDNVIKTKPPLCFTKKNVETVINIFDKVLKTYYKKFK